MLSVFTKPIELDEEDRAINIKLNSFGKPHMRAFHLSWISFLTAFTAWFAIPPLIPTLKKELKLTDDEIGNSNLTSGMPLLFHHRVCLTKCFPLLTTIIQFSNQTVGATIGARLVVGPLCDRYGPKRVMAVLLFMGAITIGLTGFVSNGTGLIVIRFFIGILGAAFVPCQFWTTKMFSPNIVGTANALAGGWGNMGGGLTYLVMPLLFNGFAMVAPVGIAWRVALVVPALLCIFVGLLDYYLGDDCPEGDWFQKKKAELEKMEAPIVDEKIDIERDLERTDGKLGGEVKLASKQEISKHVGDSSKKSSTIISALSVVLKDHTVIVLMLQYACSFGLELAVDNVIGNFFYVRFGMDQTTSGMLGSIFGLLNIVSRPSGGFFADRLNKVIGQGVQGRILAQQLMTLFEGVFLIAFSYSTGSLASAIAVMILFSFFVQATCGTTFSMAPFVNREHFGLLAGLIGAGGNLGGVIFNFVFKAYGVNYEAAFKTIGVVVVCVSLLTLVARVQGEMLWMLVVKPRK
ncbi:major facilitator superfamily domain-containing protein [Jimgerdemannia flammicorona]|uniref:Major facilitator superfamily domain-containing protein n=1 Tax=Jimgerdemannia flammicorona TaxID=994334 RepID=A0A433D8R3_9FUNG|nr:major facilitator superfamily domain-containing protein [Jimgerdemannia flammicorona]